MAILRKASSIEDMGERAVVRMLFGAVAMHAILETGEMRLATDAQSERATAAKVARSAAAVADEMLETFFPADCGGGA